MYIIVCTYTNSLTKQQDKINRQVLQINELERSLGLSTLTGQPMIQRQYSSYMFRAHTQVGMDEKKKQCAVFGYIRETSLMDIPDSILKVCLRFYAYDENSEKQKASAVDPDEDDDANQEIAEMEDSLRAEFQNALDAEAQADNTNLNANESERESSVAAPDLFGDDDSDSDSSANPVYIVYEAHAKSRDIT